MNRFTRLKELRRLEEEAAAGRLGRARLAVSAIQERLETLTTETAQGRVAAIEDVVDLSHRLPPQLYETFYQGQAWRRQQLHKELEQAREGERKAEAAWRLTRLKVKQLESLEEKEGLRLKEERARQELKELDMVGAVRHRKQA